MLAFEIPRVGARFSHATVPGFPMERCYTTGYAIYAIFPNLLCLIKLRKLHKLCNRASLPREALASNKNFLLATFVNLNIFQNSYEIPRFFKSRRRPYLEENTRSHPNTQVKPQRARQVPRRGTARENLRVLSAFREWVRTPESIFFPAQIVCRVPFWFRFRLVLRTGFELDL